MIDQTGTRQTPYGFTGETEDDNGLLYLRARYLSSQFGNFLSHDPFEGMSDRPMSLNGYSYVEGNPVNETDPSGMLFWSFPSASRKKFVDESYNQTNRPAHAWIERWLEEMNGFWATQIEFPGGSGNKLIDAIVFPTDSPVYQSPFYAVSGGFAGYVFEIEPAEPRAILTGLDELFTKYYSMANGWPPFSKTGKLPPMDYWLRDVPRSLVFNGIDYANQPYDWTDIRVWIPGVRLGSQLDYGPYRVDPAQFGGPVGVNAWWVFLLVPGLIAYVSERKIEDALGVAVGTITIDEVFKYFIDMYDQAKNMPGGDRLPPPNIAPGYAYAPSTSSSPGSPGWQLSNTCNTGLCVPNNNSINILPAAGLIDILLLLLALAV